MATKRGEDLESDAITRVRAALGRPLNASLRAFNLISEVVQLGPFGRKLLNRDEGEAPAFAARRD